MLSITTRVISLALTDGTNKGVKIAEVSNRLLRGFLIPRLLLNDARDWPELNQPALYILCNSASQEVYIGESENFLNRVKSHDLSKEFWDSALAFVMKDNSLEKGDVKFLEATAISTVKLAGRYRIHNKTAPDLPNLSPFKVPVINDLFEDIKLLSATFGYPMFEILSTESIDDNKKWYCNIRSTQAVAIQTENGFTVLKGSIIDNTERPSYARLFPAASAERNELLLQWGIYDPETDTCKLTQDLTFTSANQAGGFCVGGHMNAWTTWRTKAGKTMDEVIRQS